MQKINYCCTVYSYRSVIVANKLSDLFNFYIYIYIYTCICIYGLPFKICLVVCLKGIEFQNKEKNRF